MHSGRDRYGHVAHSQATPVRGHRDSLEVMNTPATDRSKASSSHHFVLDSELGWGRVDNHFDCIQFFDSPTKREITIQCANRAYRAATLPPQERAWWFDGDRWLV